MEIQQSLGYLLNTGAKLMKRKLDAQLKSYGITTAQWAVLKLLSAENDLSQADIADKLSADRATGGSIIEKLVTKGFLQKDLSTIDRRSYRVKILPQAIEMVNEITYLAEEVNTIAVQGLTNEEILVFQKCLGIILENLGDEKNEIDG